MVGWLVGVGWGWLVLVGVGWCWLVLVGVGWCWLVLVGVGWGWLGLVGVGWCWLGLVGDGWCWLGMVGDGWGWLGKLVGLWFSSESSLAWASRFSPSNGTMDLDCRSRDDKRRPGHLRMAMEKKHAGNYLHILILTWWSNSSQLVKFYKMARSINHLRFRWTC